MKSTRERILQTLLNHPRSTITDLAEAVGINAISVRHHLTSLEADALVTAEEERHGVGRPRLVYFLTEKGLERFPTKYLQLTTRLLNEMKETFSPQVVNALFTHMASGMANGVASQAQDLPIEARLDLIQHLLTEEGFTVEWTRVGDQYLINEITCPYYHVGQSHPEVCTVDQTLISSILEVPAEKIRCILRGDAHCTYMIPVTASKENRL
jgi:DeoR family transcriptional regulator, suf operon transcriptional repressor